jgi:hypothetical protein
MFTPVFIMPVQVESLQHAFIDTFEYRLHTIKIKVEGHFSTAQIYDGTRQVGVAHGADREDALAAAKQWIDEQDEVTPLYDLHQPG